MKASQYDIPLFSSIGHGRSLLKTDNIYIILYIILYIESSFPTVLLLFYKSHEVKFKDIWIAAFTSMKLSLGRSGPDPDHAKNLYCASEFLTEHV